MHGCVLPSNAVAKAPLWNSFCSISSARGACPMSPRALNTVSQVRGLSPVPSSLDNHLPTTSTKQPFAILWQLWDTSSLTCFCTPRYKENIFHLAHICDPTNRTSCSSVGFTCRSTRRNPKRQ